MIDISVIARNESRDSGTHSNQKTTPMKPEDGFLDRFLEGGNFGEKLSGVR